jgi:hypothetical protein
MSHNSRSPVERRNLPRRRIKSPVLTHDSNSRFPAAGVDFHEQGALLIANHGWTPETVLFLDFPKFWVMGFAEVHYCTPRRDRTSAIGLPYFTPLMQKEVGTWHIERVTCPAEQQLNYTYPGLAEGNCPPVA